MVKIQSALPLPESRSGALPLEALALPYLYPITALTPGARICWMYFRETCEEEEKGNALDALCHKRKVIITVNDAHGGVVQLGKHSCTAA